jgi:hypothetical protein
MPVVITVAATKIIRLRAEKKPVLSFLKLNI